MHRINTIENQFIEDGTPLITKNPDEQLYRIKFDTFAATTALDYCLLAFRSSSLATLIDEHQNSFSSYAILRMACAIGPDTESGLMLSLRTDNGTQFLLNEQDEIRISKKWEPRILSATKAWGMPPDGHLACMLLSARLVARIEELSLEDETASRRQILLLMYREYQILKATQQTKSEPIQITGEHFRFEAKPYNTALTFFDLI
jgi:hypothetical protein